MKIRDERVDNSIKLKHIEAGDCFLWTDHDFKCMRMCEPYEDVRIKDGGVPCVVLSSGQMVLIDLDTYVTPINAVVVLED